jgi:hypothetical protein
MAEGKESAKWSIVVWGGAAFLIAVYGAWCVWDGWFRQWEKAGVNKLMAYGCGAAVLFCIWQGAREYRTVKRQIEGQGSMPLAPGGEGTAPQGPTAARSGKPTDGQN